jgi:hypothetical protein
MSNYKRKEVFDYLTRKPVTTQDIELARTRIQTPVAPLPMQDASGEGLGTVQKFNEGERVKFAEGSITPEQIEIAKKIYGKNFEELTPNQRYKIRKGDLKPGSISFEQYLEDYKKMTNDPNYKPEYIKPATGTGLPAEQRRARTEAAQSIEGFEEKLLKNINKNKKLKRSLDPEKREYDLSRKAERRDLKRLKEKDVSLSSREAEINLEQRKLQRSINQVIRKNPSLILNNKDLMDKLSITISKEGDIIKVPTTVNEKYLKERGLFEIDHQRDIYKEGRGKNLPYNRNLILGPYNRAGGFKDAAEKFIEKNPTSDKIQNILQKAEELKITLQPNVPEGTFKTKGIGYKQIADPIEKFKDVAKPVVDTFNEPSLAARMSNQLGFGPSGMIDVGEEVVEDVKGIYGKYAPKIAKGALTGLQIIGTPLASSIFYGTDVGMELKQAADEGNLTAKKAVDAFVGQGEKGLYFLLPELAKDVVTSPIANKILQLGSIGRFATPVGLGLSAAGVAKDFYDQYKEFQALPPEEKEKRIKESTYTPTEQDFQMMQEAESRASAATGGRIGYANGSDDPESDLYIPPLDKSKKTSKEGIYNTKRLGPEDSLSKYKSYSEEELLGNIEAKYPNQLQSFSLEDYLLNTMPMFEPKDVAPPKSYSPMPVEKYLKERYQIELAEGGPSDPSKRKFIKGAGIVGAVGVASKFIPDLFQAAKKTKIIPKKAPFVNIVKPFGATETKFPEWFPSLVNRLRKEGDTKPIYATEEIPLTKEQYLKLKEKGTDRIYDRYTGFTENYVNELKQKGVPQHYQIKDTDEIIGYEYIDKNLPDVKAVEYGGQEMNVYFKNNYGQSVEIQYVSPGTKTKEGQFAVADARPEPGSYYDSAPDFEQVYVTDIDEVLGGSGKVEQYATKAKTPRYTKGAAEVDEAEGRALSEIDRLKDEGLIDD